jgi:uncharacterized membrane protein (UPF0182 family)
MRVPTTDVPRRSIGPRAWLIGAAIVLLLLVTSLRGIARFYTDFLWFDEVGFADTWRSLLAAKIVPAAIFSAIFFVVMLLNLYIADRIAPRQRSMGTEDEIIEKYRTYVAPYAGRLRVGVSLFFAIVMGGGVAAQWRDWILFSNAVDFGVDDRQFGRDIGFYVFRLPFLEFAFDWAFAALLVVLIVTAVFHYVNGGIRLQSPFQRVTPQVKVHLSVILALMALTKTAQYYLGRYELMFSHRGVVDGAGYTDVKAQLPALNFLMIISIAAAVLFIANIFRRGWVFPIIAVGLWGFISIVVGTIYPAYIQRIQVQPNEFSREQPYIERNIEATRKAFGLDKVEERDYEYTEDIDAADVRANQATLQNARLWDPDALAAPDDRTGAFEALEALKPYFAFRDVDVDRYSSGLDSKLPAMVSVRELDTDNIPSRTWTNSHLVYTHGYGAVIAAANEVDNAEPSFLVSNIPPEGEPGLELEEPGIYFGENLGGFAVVDTKVPEIEPARGDEEQETRYGGEGGVSASSFVRKAALALRFGSWDLFASGQLTGDSRILYLRDIRDRVETAAPFLDFDADPYPVVLDGRVTWVVDAYTTTNRYPYSQSTRPDDLPAGSGLNKEFNYVRNSVKATVDAYDGTVQFYVIDPDDPIVRAYRKAFPDLFRDVEDAPDGLAEHWRYPEDLFKVQTDHYSEYHMTDVREFYGKEDLWDITPDTGEVEPATPGTTGTTVRGNDGGRNSTLSSTDDPVDPLYQTLRLPGEEQAEFVITRPFVPRGRANQLTAFMVARSDPGRYGRLVVYDTPDAVAPSPAQAATAIESQEQISEQFTLLSRAGSRVFQGAVQLLPIDDSILYMRPIWVVGSGASPFPRLRFVAMTHGQDAVLGRNVREAIAALFEDGPIVPPDAVEDPTEPQEPTEPEEPTEPTEPTEPLPDDVDELLAQAQEEFELAEEARAESLAEYERHIRRAQDLVAEAQRLLDGGAPAPTTTPPTTVAPAAGEL